MVFSILKSKSQEIQWIKLDGDQYTIYFSEADKHVVNEMENYVQKGLRVVSDFLDKPFRQKVDVYIFPDRNTLDHQWQKAWNDSSFHSQCWMVASGVSNRLDLLSPLSWKKESCEHDYQNKDAIEKLIAHELTHVFHGQYNPTSDFAGMDNAAWFVEGLATYVSGQLDSTRVKEVKTLYDKQKLPVKLSAVWSGKAKYAQAGSLIKYIDEHYGREALQKLLAAITTTEMLNALNITEEALLSQWKKTIH